MNTHLCHAPISSAEGRTESADSYKVKSFLQTLTWEADRPLNFSRGRGTLRLNETPSLSVKDVFNSQETSCTEKWYQALFCWHLDSIFPSQKIGHTFFPLCIFLRCNQKSYTNMEIWKVCNVNTFHLDTGSHISISHHIWTRSDLNYQPASFSWSHTSHPSHLSLSTHCPLVPSSLHSGGISPPVVSRLVMILYLLMCWKMIVLWSVPSLCLKLLWVA